MPVKGCRGSEVDDRHLNGSGRLNHQCLVYSPKTIQSYFPAVQLDQTVRTFYFSVIQNRAAAPEEIMSCRTQGNFHKSPTSIRLAP